VHALGCFSSIPNLPALAGSGSVVRLDKTEYTCYLDDIDCGFSFHVTTNAVNARYYWSVDDLSLLYVPWANKPNISVRKNKVGDTTVRVRVISEDGEVATASCLVHVRERYNQRNTIDMSISYWSNAYGRYPHLNVNYKYHPMYWTISVLSKATNEIVLREEGSRWLGSAYNSELNFGDDWDISDFPAGEYKATATAINSYGTITTETFDFELISDIVNPTEISLSPKSTTVNVGETITLTAALLPINATQKVITWSSNDSSVATVNEGEVTGISSGTAIITATTSNGLTDTCILTVPELSEDWSGYYKIYTASDFNNIRNDPEGRYVLMNDINLSAYSSWEPIGYFTGVLDGNGYTISGVRIYDDSITLTSQQYQSARYGLIAYADGAIFKNLSVDISVALTFQNTVANAIGGICGYVFSDTLFENCHVTCDFDVQSKSMSCVGGVCGKVNFSAEFINCSVSGTIEVNTQSSGINVGGICSNLNLLNSNLGTLQDCVNTSDISAVRLYNSRYDNSSYERQFGAYVNAGGIIGCAYEGKVSYINCKNSGTISTSLYNKQMTVESGYIAVGGIVGCDNKGENRVITNCISVPLGAIYLEDSNKNYRIYTNWDIGKKN